MCRHCWQPTHFFLDFSQKLPTPLVVLRQIIVALCWWTFVSFLRPLQFNFDPVFTTASVKTLLSLIRLLSSLVDTWSLVYHMTARGCIELMFLSIILPWLRIWIYFTVKPLGIKVIGLVLILWKLCNGFGHIVFILALDFHSIIIWRNFDCMVLRLGNTNIYNMHQVHGQVYKVW